MTPPGTLTVVATPLGNEQDLSPRAATALRNADLIVAEDTRSARRLLAGIGATKAQSVVSCFDANEAALCLNSAATARGNAEHPIRDLTAMLRRIGKPEWIEPQFRAALPLAPDDAGLLHAYADFLYDAGRAEEAVPPLRAALRLRPDAMPARNLLALALAAHLANQPCEYPQHHPKQ